MNERVSLFFALLVIVSLGFAIYHNSSSGEFIWDDDLLIKNNIYIKSWSSIPKIFATDWGSGAGITYTFYRPLAILTYMFNYSLVKFDVRLYHFTNVFLHVLTALALFWLLSLLFKNRALSLLTSLFFLVHPIQTEVVSYISGRADSLAALFMILSFTFYVKYLRAMKAGFYILMFLTYVMALLSKENALVLPFLVLIFHFAFKKKIKIFAITPLFFLALFYVAARFTILKSAKLYVPSFAGVTERIPGFFVAILNYLRLMTLPVNLHMEYGKKFFSFADPLVIAGACASAILIAYALSKKIKTRFFPFPYFGFSSRFFLSPTFTPLPFLWQNIISICLL